MSAIRKWSINAEMFNVKVISHIFLNVLYAGHHELSTFDIFVKFSLFEHMPISVLLAICYRNSLILSPEWESYKL